MIDNGIWRPFGRFEYRKPWRIHDLLKCMRQDIKWSHQRIWRGYCDYDLFSIDHWFMKIMPEMLQEFKKKRHGSPEIEGSPLQLIFLNEDDRDQDVHHRWDKILERMIFLLREMNEDTCSHKNPYRKKYFAAVDKYREGPIENPDGSTTYRYKDLKEVPEYRELDEKYHKAERRLARYRMDCKKEFFDLFSQYFFHLWD